MALNMDRELVGTEPFSEEELSGARRYSVVIQWSPEDAVFIAEVPQLPGAKTHGETPAEAAELAAEVAALWIRMAKLGHEFVLEPHVLKAIA
jgi:predicted RNase H-like HicB family nuclease